LLVQVLEFLAQEWMGYVYIAGAIALIIYLQRKWGPARAPDRHQTNTDLDDINQATIDAAARIPSSALATALMHRDEPPRTGLDSHDWSSASTHTTGHQ